MKKDLSYYLEQDYPVLITQYEEDGEIFFEAEIPDLPGCGARGKDKVEALERIEEAKELWISARLKRNLPIPESISTDDFSGKYLLRIPPRLHMQLARRAKKEGISLNQYLRRTLERTFTFENILEKIGKIEQEVKQIREKIERPEVAYVETGRELQPWWEGSGLSTTEMGGMVACTDIRLYKSTSGGVDEIKY